MRHLNMKQLLRIRAHICICVKVLYLYLRVAVCIALRPSRLDSILLVLLKRPTSSTILPKAKFLFPNPTEGYLLFPIPTEEANSLPGH